MTAMELDLDTSIASLLVLADRIERGEPIAPPVVRAEAVVPEPEPVVAPETELVAPEPVVAPEPEPVLPEPEAVVVAEPEAVVPEPEPVVAHDLPPEVVTEEPTELPATELAVCEPPVVRTEDVLARLEQIREEISNLTGRRLGSRGRRRLEEVQAEERAILRELGFDSYLDVMIAAAAGVQPGSASSRPSVSFVALPEPVEPEPVAPEAVAPEPVMVPEPVALPAALSLSPPPEPTGADGHADDGGGGNGAATDGAVGAEPGADGAAEVDGGVTIGRVPGGGGGTGPDEPPVATLADWFQSTPAAVVADWTVGSASVDG